MRRLQILWGICLFNKTFQFIDPYFTTQKAQQQQQQQQQPTNSTDLKKCSSPKKHPAAKTRVHDTGWLIGILIMVRYNPYITG